MKKVNILLRQVIIFSLITLFSAFKNYAMEQGHPRSNGTIIPHCATCSKDARYKCKNCKQISYCSVDCQRSDWPNHKPNCQVTAQRDRLVPAAFHTEYMRNRTSSEESLELHKEFNDAILKNFPPPFSVDMVWTNTTCLDYVLFKTMEFLEYVTATHILQIKVNEANNSIPYFKSKNFYFVEKPQKNDIIIYFDSSGKAIHFGVMDTSTKVISKPGCLAKSIFIHDIDAYENLYGKDVKFMRRD